MSDKNFEEKLKKHWREEADSIPVPDSLHPAKIEEMIDKKMEVPKKRTHKKLYAGITAAAACLALLIAGTAYYFNTGQQSEKGTPVANSKQTISDRHEFVGNTSYSEIYSLIQKYHDEQSMSDIAAEDSASTGAKSSTGAVVDSVPQGAIHWAARRRDGLRHGRRHRQNRRFLYLYHVK